MTHAAVVTDLLTPKEAGAFLRISEGTLASWRSLRTGPAYCLVGRLVRYRRAELESWMQSNTSAVPRASCNARRAGILASSPPRPTTHAKPVAQNAPRPGPR